MTISTRKSFISERVAILRDGEAPREKRIFAALELVCFPVSVVSIALFLPGTIFLSLLSVSIPEWWMFKVLPVFLAAAVGYLTNFIAIEMLFKPFKREPFHPLTLLTFGIWKQGLVPKNKNLIGIEMGREIENRLLNPEEIADELCEMAAELLQDERTLTELRKTLQTFATEKHELVSQFLIPKIERAIDDVLGEEITSDNVRQFCEETLLPYLSSEEARELLSSNIVQGIQRQSPQLLNMLKSAARNYAYDFLSSRLPFFMQNLVEPLASGFVAFIDWESVQAELSRQLSSEKTRTMISDELLRLVERLQNWIRSPESAERLESFRVEFRTKISLFVEKCLRENVPIWIEEVLNSEDMWRWFDSEVLPEAKKMVESFLHGVGKDQIQEKLNLSERVAQAVEKQDVEEFYHMINKIAAQHFSAIQVLGFLLGGLVGLLQLALRLTP
ncbi:MAG: DUF445 family protein [Planctomycetia bacterium]|nr:DUF445 family protein [Planctomycetia bacterium]